MSFLFGSKKQAQPTIEKIYDPFESVRTAVNSEIQKKIGKPATPFKGELYPDFTDEEKKALQKASQFAESPTSGVFNMAKDEVTRVLSPDYDPSKSPFYQAVKAEASKGLDVASGQVDAAAAAGRRFNSGAKVKAKTNLITDVNQNLNTMLSGIARDDRTNAITQARGFQSDEDTRSQNAIKLLSILGGTKREAGAAKDSAEYGEFLRQEQEPLDILRIAMGLAQQEPMFVEKQPEKKKGGFSANDALQLLSLATMFIPGGQAAGAAGLASSAGGSAGVSGALNGAGMWNFI